MQNQSNSLITFETLLETALSNRRLVFLGAGTYGKVKSAKSQEGPSRQRLSPVTVA